MAVILVGGGARSGKSRYSLELARARGGSLAFIATAERSDDDMSARIDRHRADRGPEFVTIEEPIEIVEAIQRSTADAIVVDCLTLWLSNLMAAGRDIAFETAKLSSIKTRAAVICVTNEVGCGIHPETSLGRRFRDEAGILNQRIGAAADEIYWMVFGHALRVK